MEITPHYWAGNKVKTVELSLNLTELQAEDLMQSVMQDFVPVDLDGQLETKMDKFKKHLLEDRHYAPF